MRAHGEQGFFFPAVSAANIFIFCSLHMQRRCSGVGTVCRGQMCRGSGVAGMSNGNCFCCVMSSRCYVKSVKIVLRRAVVCASW